MSPWVIHRLESFKDRPAVAGSFGRISYADLLRLVTTASNELNALKLTEPNTFAVVGEQGPATIAWLIALASEQHFIIPLAGEAAEHPKKLALLSVQWVIVCDGLRWKLLPRVDESAIPEALQSLAKKKHAGLVLFSSGSSGTPKAMVQDFDVLIDVFESRHESRLPIIALMGADHIGGINTMLNTLCSGALLVIPGNRSPQHVAELIRTHHVAVLPATPTFLNLLLVSGEINLPSVRLITYGTEPMPESLLYRLRESFPKVRFAQTFGTSETGIIKVSSPAPDSTFMSIDDKDVEWKIIDEELWLRSKTQVPGYINASNEAFAADGWFRTGDKVELGPNGTMRVLGRLGELINVGGEKLMPTEVESVIITVPGVMDCRVFGERNLISGQTVAAEVVARPATDLEALRTAIRIHCRSKLAAYKIPTRVNFVSAIAENRLKKSRQTN